MAKLYPPYIEGSIPAFFGTSLTVPYEMNKTVGYEDISGFELKITTVSTNKLIAIIDTINYDINKKEVYFNMPVEKMVISQFYKIQLAYINKNNEVGFFSSLGVVKYCAEPRADIENLNIGTINLHQYEYLGNYTVNKNDITEKETYYQFDVYNSKKELYYSTGKKIHNASADEPDFFEFGEKLEDGKTYYIQYSVWTINGLKVSTKKYRIMQQETLPIEMNALLISENNYDEGYIAVSIDGLDESKYHITGTFALTKASEEDNYKTWNEIYNFELRNQCIEGRVLIKDFLIKQGVKYKYALQQYNDAGLYSNPIVSLDKHTGKEGTIADFEDMFLFDGKRQLKIKFNGKMNSFKTSMLEQKINTIGNKYPFIFRNGNVAYKEFPLNGLISQISDKENLFMTMEDIKNYHRHKTPDDFKKEISKSTDLTAENYTNERIFKMAVLDWLNDGQPKYFKSPSEGNFIVRTINTSLSPEVALGRMIHNFTTTAYEIAEINYKNMLKYNFIQLESKERLQMRWKSIPLFTSKNNEYHFVSGVINEYPAVSVDIIDMTPGDIIYIDDQAIKIGANGSFYISLDKPIEKIEIPEGAQYHGIIIYSYYINSFNQFDKIWNIHLEEVPLKQINGECQDLFAELEDARTKIAEFSVLRFYRKFDYEGNKFGYFYEDEIQKSSSQYEINNKIFNNSTDFSISDNYEDFIVTINNVPFSIAEIEKYEVVNFDDIYQVSFGKGVVCECAYQTKIISYNIEINNLQLNQNKNNWIISTEEFKKALIKYDEKIHEEENKIKDINYNNETYFDKKQYLEEKLEKLKNEYNKYLGSPDYSMISLEDAIKQVNDGISTEREKIDNEIETNIALALNEEEREYWEGIQEIWEGIKNRYPIKNYLFKDSGGYKKYATVSEDDKQPTPTGFEISIDSIYEIDTNEGILFPIAFYGTDDTYFQYELAGGSFWVETDGNLSKEKAYVPRKAPSKDINSDIDLSDENGTNSIYVDVFSYTGLTDPDNLLLDVDIWIEEENSSTNTSDLNKNIDIFRYRSTEYKDIAYKINGDNNEVYYKSALKGTRQAYIDNSFESETYVFRLDTQYYLYRQYKREEISKRLNDLLAIETEQNKELSYLENIEKIYLQDLLKDPNNNEVEKLDYFIPFELKELFDGSITLAHGSPNSILLKYEHQNLDFVFSGKNINEYFYYQTQDIWKIKDYQDKISETEKELANIENKKNNSGTDLENANSNIESYIKAIETARKDVKDKYDIYLNNLTEALEGEE